MPNGVTIAEIRIASTIERKINEKHRLTANEVREAFIYRRDVRLWWEDHEVHGRRLIGVGKTGSGRDLIVVLLPVDSDPDCWVLKTARARD